MGSTNLIFFFDADRGYCPLDLLVREEFAFPRAIVAGSGRGRSGVFYMKTVPYLVGCAILFTAMGTPASAQQFSRDEALLLLERAKKSREAAERALQDARIAEARAAELLGVPLEGTGPGSERDFRSEAVRLTQRTEESPRPLSLFAHETLGLDTYQAYAKDDAIGFKIAGSKDGSDAKIGPVFTSRFFNLADSAANGFYASRLRTEIYLRAALDDDGIGEIGSIAGNKFGAADDVGVGFDFRWSRTRTRDLGEARNNLASTLSTINKECIEARKGNIEVDRGATSNCANWIDEEDKGLDYYLAGIGPFFGLEKDGSDAPVSQFLGVMGEVSRQKEAFFPFSDPAGTGAALVSFPLDLEAKGAESKRTFHPYLIKLYGGTAFKEIAQLFGADREPLTAKEAKAQDDDWRFYLAGSLGYQAAVEYPEDSEDVDLCFEDMGETSPTRGFIRCKEVNIAAPYSVNGATVGLGLNVKFPKTRFGEPEFGALVSYFDGTEQWKTSIPFAVAVDDKGKLKAGVQFVYESEGRTPWGDPIEGSKVFGIFLQHELEFPFVP